MSLYFQITFFNALQNNLDNGLDYKSISRAVVPSYYNDVVFAGKSSSTSFDSVVRFVLKKVLVNGSSNPLLTICITNGSDDDFAICLDTNCKNLNLQRFRNEMGRNLNRRNFKWITLDHYIIGHKTRWRHNEQKKKQNTSSFFIISNAPLSYTESFSKYRIDSIDATFVRR